MLLLGHASHPPGKWRAPFLRLQVMYVWSCKTLQSPEKGVLLMNTYCPDRLIDTLKLLRSARWGCDDFYESTVHMYEACRSTMRSCPEDSGRDLLVCNSLLRVFLAIPFWPASFWLTLRQIHSRSQATDSGLPAYLETSCHIRNTQVHGCCL